MSHYQFIRCCCFQLCNAFRQNMEIDQCMLESLPLGQRQRLVRRMRCDQIRAYYEREKSLQRQGGGARPGAPPPLRKERRVRFGPQEVLQDAIARHDDRQVLRLLEDGADPRAALPTGGTLLHLCARHDNVFAAEVLLERGLDPDQPDQDLWSALHVACACDHVDLVLLLLATGVNVLLQDVDGNAALEYAPPGSESRCVLEQHLEENGVDLASVHALRTQRASSMLSDVRRLVESEGSLDQTNADGVTLLHMACAGGYKEVALLLLEGGADPHPHDRHFWTPLHLAAKYGQTTIVSQMLQHQANPTLVNCNHEKPSDLAASEAVLELLLRGEESWLQRLTDPSAPPPAPDPRYEDLEQHDHAPPIKSLNPHGLPISKRDSLLEKWAMFRDSGGGLSRHASQDHGLDGPYCSGAGKLEQVKLTPPAPNDDLASLSQLTDSSLMYEMQKRFANDQIYTYIGHILLLVNPHKALPIYSTLVSQLYLSSTGRLCSSLPPHVFSSAERAYHMMLQERRAQCFILSGESGSGKTEAGKHILRHLTSRSSPKGFALEPRMKHVNCILEAFGHAETPRNRNASRFVKLVTLQYCERKRTLQGARLHTFMLEKARVVQPPGPQHRSFSVFYLMAEGMTLEERSSLQLSNMLAHRYLSPVPPGEPPAVATASPQSREGLLALRQALRALGLSKQEVQAGFGVLAALLLLGDLGFTALTDTETTRPSDPQLLERVAGMLQVSSEELSSALTSDVQYFKGEAITRRHTVAVSEQCRDQLAKSLYSGLFSHLVNRANEYLQGPADAPGDAPLEIGILDIFGFEEFQRNGFEQLCVNLTNERVRQHVSEVLFQQEQAECLQEGVAMETILSPGNRTALLDFFLQKPQGLLYMVDEESQSLRPAEPRLYQRLAARLEAGPAPGLSLSTQDGNGNPPPQDQGPAFTVCHYAGQISYDLTGTLSRNKDSLPHNLLLTMKSSESVLLRQIFRSRLSRTGSLIPAAPGPAAMRGPRVALLLRRGPSAPPGAPPHVDPCQPRRYQDLTKVLKKKGAGSFMQSLERCGPITAGVQLRNSLSEVLGRLQASTPHLVECVRPNARGQPGTFCSAAVSAQLHNIGVLDMVRSIRYGYPVRLRFQAFLSRYRDLVDTTLGSEKKLSAEEKCRTVLQHSKLQGWQMGSTKVFLRYWQADQLNGRCHQLHKKILTVQKVVRGWLARRRVSLRDRSLQRFLRGAEDLGLRAYDRLVIQNAGDIARESDRLRCPPLGERPEPVGKEEEQQPSRRAGEPAARAKEGSGTTGGRLIRHLRSSSVPTPLVLDHPVHPAKPAVPQKPANPPGEDGGGLASPRKQPPPKPKRDPNTRLSASYEAVCAGLSLAPAPALEGSGSPGGSPPRTQLSPTDPAALKPRPHSDDYTALRKVPPPKPKRSPNTRLTGSYEEISAAGDSLHTLRPAETPGPGPARLARRAASVEAPPGVPLSLYRQDEAVYIEMGGAAPQRARSLQEPPLSPEAVYEEMIYLPPEEAPAPTARTPRPEALGLSLAGYGALASADASQNATLPGAAKAPQGKEGVSASEIPAPFPNLLPHRPPLLVFPPSPVTCSPASDESPLTPLEVKKLPVFETNLNYPGAGPDSPLSPRPYSRQRADSSPSLTALMPADRATPPPLTPPPPPASAAPAAAPPPPPYRPPSHFPFPPESGFLSLSRPAPPLLRTAAAADPLGRPPPYSPGKGARPEARRALSCSSSPLLFNPANGRALSSPLEELSTLFSSGRPPVRRSGRRRRDAGFNSNINLPGQDCGSAPTSPSPQLQDKNANNHTSNSSSSAPTENGNQVTNGSMEDVSHSKTHTASSASLHRHLDRHHTQRSHLNFSPFGAGAAL